MIGHSAGAHLCQMALLSRAKAAAAQARRRVPAAAAAGATSATAPDARMPKRFIGMAGVYDIAKHFDYESLRGVQVSSCDVTVLRGPKHSLCKAHVISRLLSWGLS